MSYNIYQFRRERDEAMLSLDESRIRTMVRKFNQQELPSDLNVFWAAVHKSITGNLSLPLEFRRKSKAWLTLRGLHSLDDGDL